MACKFSLWSRILTCNWTIALFALHLPRYPKTREMRYRRDKWSSCIEERWQHWRVYLGYAVQPALLGSEWITLPQSICSGPCASWRCCLGMGCLVPHLKIVSPKPCWSSRRLIKAGTWTCQPPWNTLCASSFCAPRDSSYLGRNLSNLFICRGALENSLVSSVWSCMMLS